MTNDELTEIAVRVRKIIQQEQQKNIKSGKVIATRDWFDRNYGESVMRELTKRRLIFPYAFGTREVTDPEGNLVKKRQGAVYYRISDVESIIEDYNIYKTLCESYKSRRCEFKENIERLKNNINH